MKKLREVKKTNELGPGVEFEAEVLSSGSWPGAQEKCVIPMELKACAGDFEVFYGDQNKRRALKWLYQYGSAELHTTYTDKRYQLVVNVF